MRILTHDQLHRTAPAIFATQPDEAVYDRYGFVPTINVVDALQGEAQLFAEAALSLRYGDDWQHASPIQPGDILEARRSEDANGSLWSRVQPHPGKPLQGRAAGSLPIRSGHPHPSHPQRHRGRAPQPRAVEAHRALRRTQGRDHRCLTP